VSAGVSAEETLPTDLPIAPRRRRRIVAGAIAALVVVPLGWLWSERRPIAAELIAGKLQQWRVPARYTVADIGLGEQRLTHVVIGDPAHPDLVADWVAVETRLGLDGARIVALRAGQVRVRGRLVDGKLSLGAVDRLLPAGKPGQPFALPALAIDVADGRMRLETPYGIIGLKLTGAGRLDNGFRGSLAAVSESVAANGCHAERLAATLKLSVIDGQPDLRGPVRAARIDCAGSRAQGVTVDQATLLGGALDRWDGSAQVTAETLDRQGLTLTGATARIDYSGGPAATTGHVDASVPALATSAGAVTRARLAGRYRLAPNGLSLAGSIDARAVLGPAWRRRLAAMADAAPGTPVAPLLAAAGRASAAAAADLALSGDVSLASDGTLAVTRLTARSPRGAVATLSGGNGLAIDTRSGRVRFDGLFAVAGGGLPDLALRVRPTPGGGMAGSGIMRRYAAGNAALALDAIELTRGSGGDWRFAARAGLSGPIGSNGRLDGGRMPITGRWQGGRLALNPGCSPVVADRLVIASVTLDRPAVKLCATGDALVRLANGAVTGGGEARDLALHGSIGATPMTIAASRAGVDLATRGFTGDHVVLRLGEASQATEIAADRLTGKPDGHGLAGTLAGGSGRIGTVPLLLSGAAGDWQFAGGKLAVTGALTVADANATPRFVPVAARDVALTLADNRIAATGVLVHPGTATALSEMRIVHDLGTGAGSADLAVPGITFTEKLQPENLTSLTKGVIADVAGKVTGEGHIRWTRDAVTSDGQFATRNMALAAAFGTVTGLTTTIRFTDLLNLESAPDQVATVALINPGVSVESGVIHYALLPDQKVRVTSAAWPFAGGRLTLAPTLLDFSEHHERLLRFELAGVDAGQFLQQFDYKNLNATGVFDGTLPIIFSDRGGRVEAGHLVARPGGGSLAYVGEVSQKDLGTWGNMAFQALKSLDYRELTIDMNGPLDGEVITDVRFAGLSQGKTARRNIIVRQLAKLPIVFNVRITAPFRELVYGAMGLADPALQIRRNLPSLIEAQRQADEEARRAAGLPQPAPPVQPRDSENKR
jgi:hypothetical protein